MPVGMHQARGDASLSKLHARSVWWPLVEFSMVGVGRGAQGTCIVIGGARSLVEVVMGLLLFVRPFLGSHTLSFCQVPFLPFFPF
jgi:hypothetical protein